MNKKELVRKVAVELDMTQKVVGEVVDGVLEGITAGLQEDGRVAFTGFGSFEVKERAERNGVNPATGEAIVIPAAKVAKFKAGKLLKDAVK